MTTLIIKMGAGGDVLRTTPLLRVVEGDVHWLTSPENACLLQGGRAEIFTAVDSLPDGRRYSRVISLEEDIDLLRAVFARIRAEEIIGGYPSENGLAYGSDLAPWFDMSLGSRLGRDAANQGKLLNRRTYQDLLFAGIGRRFSDEEYVLPRELPASELSGDIAFAPGAGPRWPMKRWAHFEAAMNHFAHTHRVTLLPWRSNLLQHLADIQGHRIVVANDSLPMHAAIGLGKPCVSFFTCTSPWEIHGYGRLEKVVSPQLATFFYRLEDDPAANAAIHLSEGVRAVERVLARMGSTTRSRAFAGCERGGVRIFPANIPA